MKKEKACCGTAPTGNEGRRSDRRIIHAFQWCLGTTNDDEKPGSFGSNKSERQQLPFLQSGKNPMIRITALNRPLSGSVRSCCFYVMKKGLVYDLDPRQYLVCRLLL